MPEFWQTVFQIVIAVPLIVLFGYAAWDVIRRPDASVGLKLVWLVVCCIFPILGPLIYLVLRPAGTASALQQSAAQTAASVGSLGELADLHDRGKLTDTEYRLLRFLMVNAGRVVSKSQILDHVWEYNASGEGNVVEPCISYLRRKVDHGEPRLIHTIRGVGYVLRIPPP